MLFYNSALHARTKHVELDVHFVRERIVVGNMNIQHVPTAIQIADTHTKPLGTTVFQELRSKLKVAHVDHHLSV